MNTATPLLELRDITRIFTRFDGAFDALARRLRLGHEKEELVALDKVGLSVGKEETVGIVGESGCGKTTLGRIAAQLLQPTSGSVLYRGRDVGELPAIDARQARLKLQMVFQNPYASLNPRMRIGAIVSEAAVAHGIVGRKTRHKFADHALARVGLPSDIAVRFPHELSGGQRQRVGIARALSVNPECVVFDEAVAALDVSIQAQILNLLIDLKKDQPFAALFITHDLNVVRFISDRIAILYLGRIVELAPTSTLFDATYHPYSRALLAETPKLATDKRKFTTVKGELPTPLSPPDGCHFHPRCEYAMDRCKSESPRLRRISPGHFVACHLPAGTSGVHPLQYQAPLGHEAVDGQTV